MRVTEQVYEYLRQQIAWAFECEARSGGLDENIVSGSFGSKCLLPPWAFSQKPIVVAVNALHDHQKSLVRLTACLPVTSDDIRVLLLPLWADFYQTYSEHQRLNSKSLPKAQRLLEYALIDYRCALEGKPLTRDKTLMSVLELKDSKSFRRDWLPRLSLMKASIAKMEREALSFVLDSVDQRRSKKYA